MGQGLEFVPLHLHWALFVTPLCPMGNKPIPYWQTHYTNNTSSRFMELLVLIQFCQVIPCWTNICGFGFLTFFPAPKICLVGNALHTSALVSVHLHVAGFFMLTMSVDYIYICIRRVWLHCQIPPFWKFGPYLFSPVFISRQGMRKQSHSSAIPVKVCCR